MALAEAAISALISGILALGGTVWSNWGKDNNQGGDGSNNQVSNKQTGNALTGYNAQANQIPRFNEQQQDLLKKLIERIQTNPNFQGIEDQARSDFQTKTIPSILQRFSSFGSNKDSGNLRGSLAGAASNLDKGLGALKAQYNLTNQGQLLQAAFQPSYESVYTPETSGILGNLFNNPAFTQSIGSTLASYFGGGEGAATTLAKEAGTDAATGSGSFWPKVGGAAAGAALGTGTGYLINKYR